MMEYTGKTVFITGGASGMGLFAGKNYASLGACVVLADIDPEALARAQASLSEYGDRVATRVCDVTDYASVVQARDFTVNKYGSADILICTAGGAETRIKGVGGNFWDIPIDVYDFGIDLNLKGAFYCVHAFMKQMVAQNGGVIITLGSVSGIEPSPGALGYSVSKAGIIGGLTPSAARAGAEHNVRVCCVTPGPVLTRRAMNNMSTLMKRAADPQELVDMFLYLTSDKASFITGQNFIVDGGRLLMDNKEQYQNRPLEDEKQ